MRPDVDEAVPVALLFDPLRGAVTVTSPDGPLILRAPADSLAHATAVLDGLGYRLATDWEYRRADLTWAATGEARPPTNHQGREVS